CRGAAAQRPPRGRALRRQPRAARDPRSHADRIGAARRAVGAGDEPAGRTQRGARSQEPVMMWLQLGTLAILPTFLVLDALMTRGAGALRGWRWRATAVTAVTFALSFGIGHAYAALF